MKKKDIQELRGKPEIELQKMLHESKADLRKAMFDLRKRPRPNILERV